MFSQSKVRCPRAFYLLILLASLSLIRRILLRNTSIINIYYVGFLKTRNLLFAVGQNGKTVRRMEGNAMAVKAMADPNLIRIAEMHGNLKP